MLKFITAGESHGPFLTGILEGIPAGLVLSLDDINKELKRRQGGYGRGGRMKIETDTARILSGVRFGETIGSPITVQIENRDFENWQNRMAAFGEICGEKVTAVRPGHADLNGVLKYNRCDARDILERSSARETAMRVALGAICKQFLQSFGIKIYSHIIKIGGITIDESKINSDTLGKIESDLRVLDIDAEERMKEKIDEAKKAGDTLGGIFEIRAFGAPAGLGSHISFDSRLDGRLAGAIMSIQAIKGVEIGAGFKVADLLGSQVHDEMFLDKNNKIYRKTNNAGGFEGGMTNGEPIIVRAAMKPIPTLMRPLNTVDIEKNEEIKASKERSDVTAVTAAAVVGEAMTAYILADAMLETFGGANMTDISSNIKTYAERIKNILPC